MKPCAHCGEAIQGKRAHDSRYRFCDDACKAAAAAVKNPPCRDFEYKDCEICGKPLKVYAKARHARKYCGGKCSGEGAKRLRSLRRKPVQTLDELLATPRPPSVWSYGAQFEAQNGLCVWCGCDLRQAEIEIDHLIPISKGGKHVQGNLILTCQKCNRQKSDAMPWEFRAWLQRNSYSL